MKHLLSTCCFVFVCSIAYAATWRDGTLTHSNYPIAHILKPANEPVSSSTTLQDDDDLKYTLAANETVSFEFVGFIESTSITPDFKYAIIAPSGATGVYSIFNNDPTTANLQYWFARTNFDGAVPDGTASTNGVIPFSVKGTVTNGSTPGELKIQWAQNTSSATAVAMKQGSALIVRTH